MAEPELYDDIKRSVRFDGRGCVPDDADLKNVIMTQAHCTPYSVHPESTKLYKDIKKTFWLPGMKKEVAVFVASCLTCHRVKGGYWRPQDEGGHDQQKSYADLHRRDFGFQVGDKVLLKVSPMLGVMRFGKRGKLSEKFIEPYEILDPIGEVAYRLTLPPALD
ncbi:uncharacterized protein LOC141601820 [Silene latifolia]|uniref:uncharacterized protein LOC141601820 n=1 Tax=Silene latifolia TaxID=37657 RepID=UPI003D775727